MSTIPEWDLLWHSTTLACMTEKGSPYGLIENGAIAVKDDKIVWVGSASQLPGPPEIF